MCVFVLAREGPKQIPHTSVREERADLNLMVRSLFTAATLPHLFVHEKKTHFLHLYFLFANEDLLLDVLFNSQLPLTSDKVSGRSLRVRQTSPETFK